MKVFKWEDVEKRGGRKHISLFGPSGLIIDNSRLATHWTYSWYFQCGFDNILLFVSQTHSHLQVGFLPVLSYANNHQYFQVTRRGVTGRPIRLPRLEPNPLRSDQLSSTNPPEAPLLIPQIHWLLLEGREKKNLQNHKHMGACSHACSGFEKLIKVVADTFGRGYREARRYLQMQHWWRALREYY